MWETSRPASRHESFTRRIFSFALAAIMAVFLLVLLASPVARAVDASWNGGSISYSGKTFGSQTADGTNPPGLSKGARYYLSTDTSRAYVIYFDSGVNEQTATTAKYAVYRQDPSGKLVQENATTNISLTPQSLSASSSRAAWSGANLTYDGKEYKGNQGAPYVADGTTPRGLPAGTQYYQHIGNDRGNGTATASLLYFPSGTDVKTAAKATYQEYEASGSGLGASIGTAKTIDVTIAADSQGGNTQTESGTKCQIDGIGWIVCPVSEFLAWGMDHIFDMLKDFLTVSTITTDTDGPLFRAWSLVRNIANVAFVIAFLIIIYSQLTGLGINNYGIKKIMPRLIVAAVLVNVSYWICAIAVDLSNITGSSLQQLLVSIRESLSGPNMRSMASWQSMTGAILAGSTGLLAAAMGVAGVVAISGASLGAAVILLLPMLAGLLLAVLVALLVLAVRQALIILLVIVSPLAFVAYLLPNTEKWFEKWRGLFLTMLVFFPIFALIFGGSQLAGSLIYQNADQINMILLGMFVQIAPLVITPILVKFSGNLVARIANLINNPNKGLIDKTRKWSEGYSGMVAARNMARTDPVRRRQVFRRFARGMDEMNRTRDARRKLYDTQNDARWTNSAAFSDIDQGLRGAQDLKSLGENNSELRYEASKVASAEMRNLDINLRDAKLRLENAKLDTDIQWERNHDTAIVEQRLRAHVSKDALATIKADHDAAYEEFKAGDSRSFPLTQAVSAMMAQSRDDTRNIALQGMRNANAKREQQNNLTNELAMANNRDTNPVIVQARQEAERLLRIAGGIQGSEGAQRALAQAMTDQHKARAESISNASAIIEHSNLSAEETLRIAQNISVKGITVTDELKEAAAKRVAGGGVVPHILELLKSVDMTDKGDEHLRNAIVDALKGNSVRPKFIGYGLMDKMTQGLPGQVTEGLIDTWVQSTLLEGKLSANELVSQDKDTLVRVNDALNRLPRTPEVSLALANLKQQISNAKSNAQMRDRAGERMTVLDDMYRKI